MPEAQQNKNEKAAVRASMTKLMKDLITENFERELRATKCHHGGNLCPDHVMRIFKKVFDKYTLVIDGDDSGVSPVQPPENPGQ